MRSHPVGRRPIAGARVHVPVERVPADSRFPHSRRRQRVREVPECHARYRGVVTEGRFERRDGRRLRRVHPELLVVGLHESHGRLQAPRQFARDLVLLVRPGERRIGARLAVVVTLVLVTREEPQMIAHDRAAEAGGEVAVPLPLVPARPSAGVGDGPHDRLTRPRGRLPVVRRVELEEIAALFGDDVEDGALHVAVLDRRARRLNLDLLNRVDAGLRARHAPRTGT